LLATPDTCVQSLKLSKRELGYHTAPICRAVNSGIVDHDRHAVPAQVDVEFQDVRAQLQGFLE